ncbi:MAG: phosphoglycolate phosphatase [Candidatus Muproteobacteria bacterium RBG_19FT_COMBO_61_10]|jgi:phosphoglycolate phosphatase|uniref:Phosphoglycolate phosphatase n=1 Tax=Candidatus Muproteobacteria bacterium RBG_19FT_COMBO_61_10 TaxID=1817761 RepID=A0A1F6UI43_9PROT|nr:MAG: phosphoglycolate phosphatase [Candidatus Muproteobacteria bacterium RBG_19FT_COMBO_61_10]
MGQAQSKAPAFPLAVKMVMVDLDGTLIHTAPDLAASANRMLQDLGRAEVDPRLIATWIGNGVPRLVKRALTGEMMAEPDAALYQRALALFQKHYAAGVSEFSRPFPGVVEGLTQLEAQGYTLACITNKAEAFTLPLLRNLDLHRFFKLILSGDSLPKQKPDPLPLLHACKHFGITPDHGLLVGDSANDVQAARAAGMPVICVPYGYNHGHDIRESHPDQVVGSLAELPQYLRPYA